jgi:hypothetical protein
MMHAVCIPRFTALSLAVPCPRVANCIIRAQSTVATMNGIVRDGAMPFVSGTTVSVRYRGNFFTSFTRLTSGTFLVSTGATTPNSDEGLLFAAARAASISGRIAIQGFRKQRRIHVEKNRACRGWGDRP